LIGKDKMTPRITSAETALLMPYSAPRQDVPGDFRPAAAPGAFDGLKRLVHGLRATLTAMRLRRETIAQLRELSDRELADIGLNRSGIGEAALPVAANDKAGLDRAA
jgi:uncharacterized protein YjiS (DUF1127 family)